MPIQPEAANVIGLVQSDPAGYLTMYNRPNPLSTAGFYVLKASLGLSGFPFPIIGTNSTCETYLDQASTQNSALLVAVAQIIEIKDKRLFLQSLAPFGSPAAILGLAALPEKLPSVPAQTTPQFPGDLGSQILEELKKIRENLGRGR